MCSLYCRFVDVISTLNSTSRYLNDLLNIDNPYFEQIVSQIYLAELHLIKQSLLYRSIIFRLNFFITNGILCSKMDVKGDCFNFEIGNYPLLDGDVSSSPSCGVFILQLIRFVRVWSSVSKFNNRNTF